MTDLNLFLNSVQKKCFIICISRFYVFSQELQFESFYQEYFLKVYFIKKTSFDGKGKSLYNFSKWGKFVTNRLLTRRVTILVITDFDFLKMLLGNDFLVSGSTVFIQYSLIFDKQKGGA